LAPGITLLELLIVQPLYIPLIIHVSQIYLNEHNALKLLT
jgi:hypothetical protein